MLVTDIINLFRQGAALKSVNWANTAAAAMTITGVLKTATAVAQGFGYDLQLSDQILSWIGEGVVGAVCLYSAVMHVVANPNAGVQATLPTSGDGGAGPG